MSPEKKPVKPLDVYVRVSRVQGREVEEEGGTAAEQEKRCRAQLQASGLKAGQVFSDLDQSGGKTSRPFFDRAMGRIESGESGGMIVLNLSRFGRNRQVPLDIEKIEQWGGTLVSVEEKLDTSSPMGKFAVDILAAVNTLYLGQISEQWKRVKANARARGVHIGKAACGYARKDDGTLVVDEESAAAVREAFKLRAQRPQPSWGAVADMLTTRGVRPSNGAAEWGRHSARAVVSNPIYMGDETHEQIVKPWLWKKAQAPKTDKRTVVRGEGHPLGGGLVRCGKCGTGLVESKSGRGNPNLRCDTPGTGHTSISYSRALEHIAWAACQHIGVAAEPLRLPGNAEKYEAAEALLAEARAELEDVEEMLGTSAPTGSRQRLAVEEAEEALAALDRVEDSVIPWYTTPSARWGHFERLSVPEQRRFLHEVITRAVLAPGRGPVEERLSIEWKIEAGPAEGSLLADGSIGIPPIPETPPSVFGPDVSLTGKTAS
jgi:DNA invertase Pin-like site-specific DNA recombinase